MISWPRAGRERSCSRSTQARWRASTRPRCARVWRRARAGRGLDRGARRPFRQAAGHAGRRPKGAADVPRRHGGLEAALEGCPIGATCPPKAEVTSSNLVGRARLKPIDAAIQSSFREITTLALASVTARKERVLRIFGIGINSRANSGGGWPGILGDAPAHPHRSRPRRRPSSSTQVGQKRSRAHSTIDQTVSRSAWHSGHMNSRPSLPEELRVMLRGGPRADGESAWLSNNFNAHSEKLTKPRSCARGLHFRMRSNALVRIKPFR
jgi:hypothetical protein